MWMADLYPGVEVAVAPLPPSFPTDMQYEDGICLVGLRVADAAAQRSLLRALDLTAQHETSYVLLAGGGLYCSRAMLHDALASGLDDDAPEPPEVVDFRLRAGFHTTDRETGMDGRPAFAGAVRATCLHNHAAAHVAHAFLQTGNADEYAARLLADDAVVTDAWRQVMQHNGCGPHVRPDRLRDFRRQQRDLRAMIALANKGMPHQRSNHKRSRSDAAGVPGLPAGSLSASGPVLVVAPGDGGGAPDGAADTRAATLSPSEAVPVW